MPFVRPRALRRRLAVLLAAIVCLIGAEVALPTSSVAPGAGIAVADTGGPAAYDRSLRAAECTLLGREFVGGLGCARARCVGGARPWRKFTGAEVCALVGQPKGYGFASTVDVRHCRALHRRWISQVNYCASQPDRSVPLVRDAPQCTRPASVYVSLSEVEGFYDECLTRERAAELSGLATDRGVPLATEVALRSGTQCPDRPGHAYVDGRCTAGSAAPPTGGGVVMVGDSVTWRGGDELTRRRPELTIDGEPARRPTELASRLDAFRARHGQPAGLIVELGTNPAPGFRRRDLSAAVGTLPPGTPVMFVLPYVEVSPAPVVVAASSRRFAGWMRSLAASRPDSCVADWPAYVRSHPGLLQDGIHPRHTAEADWARWIADQWERC